MAGIWPTGASTVSFFLFPKGNTEDRSTALLPTLIVYWECPGAPAVLVWKTHSILLRLRAPKFVWWCGQSGMRVTARSISCGVCKMIEMSPS